MKKSISITLSLALLAVFSIGLSSCNKCTVAEEDTYTGVIISESSAGKAVVIYCATGYLPGDLGGNFHITGNSQYADRFEVSFDGGETKGPVNWGSYDILCNPMIIKCKASFVRDVTIDNNLGYAYYNVDATTCSSCENERYVENYVLVPKMPAGYTVFFDQEISEN